MNADDSAKLRNLLANNRTLLAYIQTALAFAGLGFAVAKFGLNPRTMHVSGYLGTFMVLVGLPAIGSSDLSVLCVVLRVLRAATLFS